MKRTRKIGLIGVLVGLMAGPFPGSVFGAASGNYTDLLPVGAAGNTTVISNGSGWSLTTLPPTQTFGDALSRVVTTVYQSTAPATITAAAVSTFTTVTTGNVGSATFPTSWVATGRSFRTSVKGKYSTNLNTWTWAIKLGTTTVLSTGSQTAIGSQTNKNFNAVALCTINATGSSGSVACSYDIYVDSGTVPFSVVSFSTSNATAVTVDLTNNNSGTLSVLPTFGWGSTGASLTASNITVEFLN